jgi:nucleolar protein 12
VGRLLHTALDQTLHDEIAMGSKKSKKSQEGSASKAGDVEGKKGKPLSFDSELDALFAAAASSAVDPIPSSSQAVQPLQENVSKPSYADSEADEDDVESGLISIMRHTVNDVVHEDSDSDSEGDGKLIHETMRQQHKKKAKVPRNVDSESQSDRDSRSIFVGNLPISLVTDRPAIKLFRRHIISQSPYPSVTQIQSIRFRSIPFAKPTDDYDARHPEEAESKMRKRKRSQAYKESQADDEGVSSEKKTFLSGAQKRKVAFINQEINDKADFVNAYVTLSQFSEDTVKKIQEQYGEQKAARLTPVVIAALLARSAHNTVFSGRHLRVDLVKSLTPQDIVQSGLDKIRTADGGMIGAMAGGSSVDQEARRRTLFVGNMDFEIREEEVRTFFDGLVTAERGQAPSAKVLDFSRCTLLPAPEIDASTEEEGGAAERSWVQDVRIIRDAATQMGKGFSYVRFLDAECVDEVIAMHESEEAVLAAAKTGKGAVSLPNDFRRKLKLKGRPLRVSRCRTSKGNVTTSRIHGTPKASANGKARSTPPAQRSRSTGAPTPGGTSPFAKRQKLQDNRAVNGSPTRKPKESSSIPNPPPRNTDPLRIAEVARKKADPERQARRMAKKSAKRTQQKLQAVAKEAGGTSGRVPLKVKAKSGAGDKDSKKHRPRKSNSTKVRSGK